ncbi:MAG: carboxymethylenebutenolidase 2 [Kordiimonas sp.]|nr:carboxymethylenebutenolidase 2 [Kordiimonas sp.]|tara:strand:- start:2911 stop:3612 length:702 start_codon:yes stop_codon:yes gene_type:complete
MCHRDRLSSLPEPASYTEINGDIDALVFGGTDNQRRIAILPDIYGANPFYQSFSTYLADKGSQVFLVNPFSKLEELPEVTREAAFERRHKVMDKTYLDQLEVFLKEQDINAVVGFCLGGTWVLELARRGYTDELVAYYPFPQGLPNADAIPTPLDYMADINTPVTVLMGWEDDRVGTEVTEQTVAIAAQNSNLKLKVYDGSAHGFLTDLESDNELLAANAQDSLDICTAQLFT